MLQEGQGSNNSSYAWKKVWKLKVPERVRVFMWRSLHRKLPTKVLTGKWSGGTETCPVCNNHQEDFIHHLRDCSFTTSVWRKLIKADRRVEFFGTLCMEWLEDNLRVHGVDQQDMLGPELFAVTCFHLWKWRNQCLHCPDFVQPLHGESEIKRFL